MIKYFSIKHNIVVLIVFTVLINLFLYANVKASFFGVSNTGIIGGGGNLNMVGHWSFDGNDLGNGSVKDIGGNNNTGYLNNIATSTFYTNGKIGQAFNFDGISNYIDFGDINSIDSATALSVCAWVKVPETNSTGYIVAKNSATNDGFLFRRESVAGVSGRTNVFTVVVANNGDTTSATLESASGAQVKNTWTNVCTTYTANSATGLRLYINGVEDVNSGVSTIGITSIDSSTNPLRVGSRSDDLDFFNGFIDDVRVLTRVLSATEVYQIYKQGIGTKISKVNNEMPTTGINSGLVGWWTFDGSEMTRNIGDKTGRGNVGFTSFGVSGQTSTTTRPGRMGQAIKLDGFNDLILLKDSADFDVGGAFSSCGWVNPTTNVNGKAVLSHTDSASKATYKWITGYVTSNSGSVQAFIRIAGSTYSTGLNLATGFLANSWHHYCATFDRTLPSARLKVYLDGGKNGIGTSNAADGDIDAGDYPTIGQWGGSGFFPGTIDDIRLYNRALSAAEVQQIYQLGAAKINVSAPTSKSATGLWSGLVGYWNFDGKNMSNGVAKDLSGSSYDANAVNISTSSAYVPGKIGQALNFDGSTSYVSSGNFSWPSGGGPVTVSFWTKTPGNPAGGSAFGVGSSDTPDRFLAYVPWTDNLIYWDYGNTTTGRITTDFTAYLDKWTYVTLVSQGTSGSLKAIYLNGVLANSSGSSDGPVSGLSGATIGASLLGPTYNNGTIDDFRIYNRVLSAKEIYQLYRQGK